MKHKLLPFSLLPGLKTSHSGPEGVPLTPDTVLESQTPLPSFFLEANQSLHGAQLVNKRIDLLLALPVAVEIVRLRHLPALLSALFKQLVLKLVARLLKIGTVNCD